MNPEIHAHSLKGRSKEEWQTLAEHPDNVAECPNPIHDTSNKVVFPAWFEVY